MSRRKKLHRLKAKVISGYYMIPKTGELPPREILDRLPFKSLDYSKYKRVSRGKKKASE